jgi:hypothetical protein
MPPKPPYVKGTWKEKCLAYVEANPRLGWYIAVLATLNVILNLIDAFDLF